MRVTGFSFVRNAVKFDYPVVESLRSILPVCDRVVVAVGASDDDTLEIVTAIDPQKIEVVKTVWDDSQRHAGRVLATETNKALEAVSKDTDWALYIQADEVMHERDYDALRRAMQTWQNDDRVDGLLLNYIHFYGSYDYVGISPRWYRREVRVIKRQKHIFSYGDAQGFRKNAEEKLDVKPADATVYHYGWVKEPQAQQRKQESFHALWHNDEWIHQNVKKAATFDYGDIDALEKFHGSHPAVMRERIARLNWQFDYDISRNALGFKNTLRRYIEKFTGWRVGEYRNYRII